VPPPFFLSLCTHHNRCTYAVALLVALLAVGLMITGTTCADVQLRAGEQVICDPMRTVFGSVLVRSAAGSSSSSSSATTASYLLPAKPTLAAENVTERRVHRTRVEAGAAEQLSWVLVEGSRVVLNVTTERAAAGFGDVDASLLLLDHSNFLLWRNGRAFEELPGTPPHRAGHQFVGSITATAPDSETYYAVLCNEDDVPLVATWNITLVRTRWNVSEALVVCVMAACSFPLADGEVVIAEARSVVDPAWLNNTVDVHMKSFFSSAFRGAVFASVGSVLLIVCIVTCTVGCCSLRRKQLPPTLPPTMPATQPLLPSPPDSPPLQLPDTSRSIQNQDS